MPKKQRGRALKGRHYVGLTSFSVSTVYRNEINLCHAIAVRNGPCLRIVRFLTTKVATDDW